MRIIFFKFLVPANLEDVLDRYHDSQLEQHIQEAYHAGWTVLPEWLLYVWYDVQRVNKNLWRDIRHRWLEIAGQSSGAPKLLVYRSNNRVLLVRADGERVPNEKKLADLDSLANDPLDI